MSVNIGRFGTLSIPDHDSAALPNGTNQPIDHRKTVRFPLPYDLGA